MSSLVCGKKIEASYAFKKATLCKGHIPYLANTPRCERNDYYYFNFNKKIRLRLLAPKRILQVCFLFYHPAGNARTTATQRLWRVSIIIAAGMYHN